VPWQEGRRDFGEPARKGPRTAHGCGLCAALELWIVTNPAAAAFRLPRARQPPYPISCGGAANSRWTFGWADPGVTMGLHLIEGDELSGVGRLAVTQTCVEVNASPAAWRTCWCAFAIRQEVKAARWASALSMRAYAGFGPSRRFGSSCTSFQGGDIDVDR